MTKHFFPTVPVDGALRAARYASPERLRPLALVVDDDPMITGTLSAILSGSGVAALTAHDGPTALETARLIPPEILIADLVLPGIRGFELAVEVTRTTRDCDVILFASHDAATGLYLNMRAAGRNFTILVKPIHPGDLLEAVFALLYGHGYCLHKPKTFQSPGLYDFLSSTRLSSEVFPSTCNVTLRQRPLSDSAIA